MKAIHTYIIYEGSTLDPLELMTQILSVTKFRELNPNTPFVFYTNSNSLKEYEKYGITELYDEINTEVLDNYPFDRISSTFWASPKLWVMRHIDEPFVILDTDLVLYETIEKYSNFGLVYLHRESPTSYPRLYEIDTPDGFEWSFDEIESFRKSFPINCACLVWNDINFLKEYTDRYFEFVFENKGELNISVEEYEWVSKHGAQIVAEQWLLAALLELRETQGDPLYSISICPVIYASVDFIPFQIDEGHAYAEQILNGSIFHLWGGKKYYEDGKLEEYLKLKFTLLEVVKSNLQQTGMWSSLEYCYDRVKSLFPY